MKKRSAIAVSLLLAVGCVREHGVELVIHRGLVPEGAPTSVEIYEGSVCSGEVMGTPIVSAPLTTGTSLPSIPPGSYSIVVHARSTTDCADVGYACVEVTISDQPVEVTLTPFTDPSGGCPPGTMCDAGQCVPITTTCREGTTEGCSIVGQICCGGRCVVEGECRCVDCGVDTNEMCCDGVCIGTLADPNNCGGCGNACASGTCTNGICGGSAVTVLHEDATVLGSGGNRFTVEAYWLQLDSSLAMAEQQIATTTNADGSLVDLPIALDPGPSVRFCGSATCTGGGCSCDGAAELAFGFVIAYDGTGPIGYGDAVLVWASRALSADDMTTLFSRMNLAELLPNGVPAGVSAYRLPSVGSTALVPSGFDAIYGMIRCEAGISCPDPIARRP